MRKILESLELEISRRAVMGGAMAAGALATLNPLPVFAQQMQTYLPPGVAPKPKGPLVFRDYDQEELDYCYDQGPWAPNSDEVGKRKAQNGAAAVRRLGSPRRFSYGPAEIEGLDLYATSEANAPIIVFIHGGTWRTGFASERAYLAETYVNAGAHFIPLDFTNVIDTGGDLFPLAHQVRRAVSWVYQNAGTFGGDANRLFVAGHSSGGHLAAVVLTTDWEADFGLPMDIVKGALFSSGMYDLHPVSLSARSEYVNFTEATIEELSPQRHLDRLAAPIIVTNGSLETPEFQRQGREFAEAVRAAGKPVTYLLGEGSNHFEIIETLGTPYGLLGNAFLEMMDLAGT
jgi:arylformamidase